MYRRDPDNISLVSATSLAPSYHTTFHDTQLIPPTYRSYVTSEPQHARSSRLRNTTTSTTTTSTTTTSFQHFNLSRNELALHKIAARKRSEGLEHTLKQFSVNFDRQEFGRGSRATHPMMTTAARRPRSTSSWSGMPEQERDDRCPLEIDNEMWDYMEICHGSYPSLEYYQRRAREISRYEEREEAIRVAHRRLCVQRSDSDTSQSSNSTA